MNLSYRTAQFIRSLNARAKLHELARAWPFLTEKQRRLFLRLPASDQLHSLRVLDRLLASGERDPDLLAAALLHDVGKARSPLSLWQRVFAVMAQAIAPGWADAAGDEQGPAWRRALAVSTCHPAWGAEMLETCGSSPKLIDLVRRHQDRPSKPTGETDRLLLRLRQADNQS